MNDDKEFKDNSFKEQNPSSSANGGNKGVTSSSSSSGGGGNSSDSDSHINHHLSFMGPNHNNLHQYHSGNLQHHGHQHQDITTSKIVSGITINSNNGHSNDGIIGSHSNNSNHLNNISANTISNGNSSSSASSSSSNNFSSEVCRDFLRNVCRRGANCRYRHPEGNEAEELGKKVDLIFCHDFQNKECRRSNCRFIHCTKQEEDIYRVTGKLPTHLIEKLSYSRLTAASSLSPSPTSSSSSSFHHRHHHPLNQSQHQQHTDFMKSVACDNNNISRFTSNSLIASTLASSFVSSFASTLSSSSSSVASSSSSSTVVASPFSNPIPVCKDNLKGDCLRGLRCKFRHISQVEYDLELRGVTVYSSSGHRPSPMDRNHFHHNQLSQSSNLMDGPTCYQGGLAPPEPKRRAYDTSLGLGTQVPFNHALTPHPPPPHSPSQRTTSLINHHQSISSIQSSSTSNDFEFSKPPPPPPPPISHATTLFNSRSYHLEDENLTLRRHIDELKKQVTDLMASNEFLMEQNAQLRTLGARSTTPLAPSTLHSNSTTSTPQLSLSNDSFTSSRIVDHHHQHQQHLPVALATSLSGQSIGSIPVSSMAALSTNILNNSTNPLVSYPLMTTTIQSLRPPTIPHSLSH